MTAGPRPLLLLALIVAFACAPDAGERSPSAIELRVPGGELVRPFATTEDARALVFLFTLTDCPISNRYAPRICELAATYGARGVRFWLVYPDATESDADVRAHLAEYGYADVAGLRALRDPAHELVRLAGATVTPEAAVFAPGGTLLYRGRIDDRHADFGQTRPVAVERDLERALDELLAGKTVSVPRTQAVGCYIPAP